MHETVDPITYTTPENIGVRSENIEHYIKRLEERGLATHSMILARGNEVFFEHYWEPFTPDFQHRMYSVSKSFVALAIGFLEQDGLIDLDDSISKYFAAELKDQPDQNMHRQTIRHMLMMSTAFLKRHTVSNVPEDIPGEILRCCVHPWICFVLPVSC